MTEMTVTASMLLNVAALDMRLNTTLLPNEILLVDTGSAGQELSFARGIPGSTTQGTAALLSERDHTRTLLADAGIHVPQFEVFGVRNDHESIVRAAERLGFPVLLSPVWLSRRSRPLHDADEIRAELVSLTKLAGPRKMRYWHPRARVMIEIPRGSRRVEYGLAHGEILYRMVNGRPVPPGRVHGEVDAHALNALSRIPGLSVGRVRLSMDNPLEPPHDQVCHVTDVVARPGFDALAPRDVGLSRRAAARLLQLEMAAQRVSIGQQESGQSRASVRIHGVALPDRAVEALTIHLADRDGFEAANKSTGVEVHCPADPDVINELQHALMNGTVGSIRPLYVSAQWHA